MPDVREVEVDELIAGAPETLYALVSDVTRMGDWSPENKACRWVGGATGPALGARFKGANRRGWRRWSTTCTVVTADPGHTFSFKVAFGPLPVAVWTYSFAAEGAGTRVTESWEDRRPGWMKVASPVVMGVGDQASHNRAGMRKTLAELRRAAEAGRRRAHHLHRRLTRGRA